MSLTGSGWTGSLAGASFFDSWILPHLSLYTQDYYVFRWNDAPSGLSANGYPDAGDSYTLMLGDAPMFKVNGGSSALAVSPGTFSVNRAQMLSVPAWSDHHSPHWPDDFCHCKLSDMARIQPKRARPAPTDSVLDTKLAPAKWLLLGHIRRNTTSISRHDQQQYGEHYRSLNAWSLLSLARFRRQFRLPAGSVDVYATIESTCIHNNRRPPRSPLSQSRND